MLSTLRSQLVQLTTVRLHIRHSSSLLIQDPAADMSLAQLITAAAAIVADTGTTSNKRQPSVGLLDARTCSASLKMNNISAQ
jgi:hypothetical protein